MINELERVLNECFWNDYKISYSEAEKLYLAGDINFKRLLVNKIISNSSCPSGRLKALFSNEELVDLLPDTSPLQYIQFRIQLVKSILFRSIEGGVRPWKK